MGRSIFDPIWAEHEHKDPYSELIHVLQGEVVIETPTYQVAGRSGDTLYTPANTPHRDRFSRGQVFEVYLIQFHWSDEKKLLRHYTPVAMAQAARAARPQFSLAFDQLHQEFTSELPWQQEMVDLRTSQILCQLFRQAALDRHDDQQKHEARAMDSRHRIMEDARRMIHARLAEPISLDELAESIGISAYYLSRVFSQQSGFTLSSYITRLRMERACELMRDSRRSIKQIAYAVGYRDSHYFSRVFKNQFQVSPSVYQRQILTRRTA